jgi:Zn-dependent M28 family amino/carboxypeptidase
VKLVAFVKRSASRSWGGSTPQLMRKAVMCAALLTLPAAGCTRVDADLSVQAVADHVSQTHYQTYHLDVENMGLGLYGGAGYDMGYRNRDAYEGPGSPGNQEARLYLQDQFAAMGLNVSVQGSYLNVVGELTGTTTPENIYIIGGHYDHLEDDRPGGDDNASGTAGVLEAARVLSQYRFESTIRFIGFNAEEDGLLGSKDYVDNHVVPAGENIMGMINLDMILRPGSDVDPHTIIDAEVEAQSKHPPSVAWAQAFQQAAADYVPSLIVNDTIVDTESTSDNDSFLNQGYPAILVIENSLPDFWDANEHYHTFEDASDRLANDSGSPSGVTYDYAFATEMTRAAVALIAQQAVLVSGPAQR